LLPVQQRTWGLISLDQPNDHRKRWEHENNHGERNRYIEQPFQQTVQGILQRLPGGGHERKRSFPLDAERLIREIPLDMQNEPDAASDILGTTSDGPTFIRRMAKLGD
jgi:hypothetical protein